MSTSKNVYWKLKAGLLVAARPGPRAGPPFARATHFCGAVFGLLAFSLAPALVAGQAEDGPASAKVPAPVKTITEEDLQAVARTPVQKFPWPAQPPPVAPAQFKQSTGPLPDMSSGDLIIRAHGEFTRKMAKLSEGGEEKEQITLNKDIEVEFPKFVLRSQRIVLWRNPKDGRVEKLEASGDVQLVTPDTKARGETLAYVVEYDAQGRELKTHHTLEGSKTTGAKATLWKARTANHWEPENVDKIEAGKFVSDEDTLRAVDHPAAVFHIPGGQLPGLSLGGLAGAGAGTGAGAGKEADKGLYRLQAEGELLYDAPLGKLRLIRNVEFQGPGMKIAADEMVILMSAPPVGQRPAEGGGMLSGSLKSLECSGRLELKAPPQTVHCDKFVLDVQRNTMVMEMKDPSKSVNVYSKDSSGPGKRIVAPKRLSVNLATNEFQAGGALKMESWPDNPPDIRK